MGEERAGGLENKPLNALREAETVHTTTQNTAIPAASLPAPPIPSPKLPAAIASLPTPSSLPKPSQMATKNTASGEKRIWNTNKIGLRMSVDALAALSAGSLVAPVIAMVDKGITENASGRNSLGVSLKNSAVELLTKPHVFLASRPFRLILFVYSTTYFAANSIDTAGSTMHNTALTATTAGTSKFIATSTTNSSLGLYKDQSLAKMFGTAATATRSVPIPSFALFALRDGLTIFASFNLPPLLGPRLEQSMSEGLKKYVSGASLAQFLIPASVQFLSTPPHLLGLDLYNRPGVAFNGPDGRMARVARDWIKSSFARMGRIVPAFGVGGVVNTKVRRNLMGKLEEGS